MDLFNEGGLLAVIAAFVFFAGIAWEHLGAAPSWVRTAVGVAAVVLAIGALLALLAF